jgi:hypothetical protein
MRKTSIIEGLQSTRSHGTLRSNLGLNRLEIMILEKGFDKGSNLS